MIKALITDFSRVLLFPRNKNYKGNLNSLHKELSAQQGYKLLEYFDLNKELLDYFKSFAEKVDLYIFTSETIQDSAELQPFIKPVFKAIFSASKMGLNKNEEKAYKRLIMTLGLAADEILFIDDSQINIDAAKKAGLQTIVYYDNASLIPELQSKLATL